MAGGKRIALGVSGGVDSSVAVAVLRQSGWDVVGVTCVFVAGEASDAAVADARLACERLGIEHAVRDCSRVFARRVIKPFVDAYAAGLTPSPCVSCNASTKIPELLAAADELGCSHVATGHYARIGRDGGAGRFAISCALDAAKDQSYMLAMLSQDQLARLVLPLGGLTKGRVREIAQELGLSKLADKPESQDICFAPAGYRALLAEHGVCTPPGAILLDGAVVGRHTGLADYTVGQRKGIGVAGPEPYYVIGKDAQRNCLHIGVAEQARVGQVSVGGLNWQSVAGVCEPAEATVKLRYRSSACPCIIVPGENSRVLVHLPEPQAATAPGQYAVFYQDATVIGGGIIEEVGS